MRPPQTVLSAEGPALLSGLAFGGTDFDHNEAPIEGRGRNRCLTALACASTAAAGVPSDPRHAPRLRDEPVGVTSFELHLGVTRMSP